MPSLTTLSFGYPLKSLDASALGAGTHGTSFALPGSNAAVLSYQVIFSAEPDAVSILIEASLDDVSFSPLATLTGVDGDVGNIITAARFVRATIQSKTGTFNTTVILTAAKLGGGGGGGATSLSTLLDVELTSVQDDDVLSYDAGTSKWINKSLGTVVNPFDQDLNTDDDVEFNSILVGGALDGDLLPAITTLVSNDVATYPLLAGFVNRDVGTVTQDFVASYGLAWNAGAGTWNGNHYGGYFDVENYGGGTLQTPIAIYAYLNNANASTMTVNGNGRGPSGVWAEFNQDATSSAPDVKLFYGKVSNAGALPEAFGLWIDELAPQATQAYHTWFDERGVFAIKAEFQQAVPRLYNPLFTKYTPGAVDYERMIQRYGITATYGTSNVAYFGSEAGGTGTLRKQVILGAGLGFEATPGVGTFLEGIEIADPAAPAANSGRIYFKDNGGGKTQLVVRFPTGAVQQIAIEP